MLEEITKQQKEELLILMLKNELAELWLTKRIADTPKEIKEFDNSLNDQEDEKKQYDKYIAYVEKLEMVLEAKQDNLFNLEYLDKASELIKQYV